MNRSLLTTAIISLLMISCQQEKGTKPIVQDIKELVFASGTLEWKNNYSLMAQTEGVLSAVNFEIGKTIDKGAILGKIDNATNIVNTETAREQLAISAQNLTANSPALLQLQQNIGYANLKYRQDKLQAERYERLYRSQSVAKAEYENYQLSAENSLSNLNALKKQYAQLQQQAKQNYINTTGQLKNSRITQQYNSLTAPMPGTVIGKLKKNGDFVKKGDVIATIGDAQRIEIILNVDESSIGKIKVGQKVFVKLNTDHSRIYKAAISEIQAAFDDKTQSFICKAIFSEPVNNGFYGTQLEANIFIGEKKNALLIPRILMDYGNRVNVKGKDEYVVIETGIISSEYVEVLKGITKDDMVLPLKN
ncbi:efflux RND transporter periplasmic adaptor subunit [Pedobacter sp. AW31-3R]|uniref:efflux RND transporter periplasmic adaptor subunit n=1 Tax=Pedobacter sp. AW31-3R TaxID=3445781 RepID=UPI003F9EF971